MAERVADTQVVVDRVGPGVEPLFGELFAQQHDLVLELVCRATRHRQGASWIVELMLHSRRPGSG